jgi:large subunit ribosomal protein L9
MQVILLERIARLGQMGDVVKVRDGYARNFLLPQGKALRANDANRKRFESERVHLEARNLERRTEAEAIAGKLNGQTFVVIRQAGETGQLYGSVSTRDLAEVMEAGGFSVGRGQIALNQPIKTIGMHPVRIALHPEVDATINVNVARSDDEAARQARGEDVTAGAPADEDEAPPRTGAPPEADGGTAAPAAGADGGDEESAAPAADS